MAAIAADWLAGRQSKDDDVLMKNMVVDDPTPTPSSTPSSLVHCTMTIGEARAQYMDRVRQMREEQFREAQADAAYNHHLLQEHLQAEEQIAAERAEQEALLDSYRSARKGRLERWRYRMRVAEAAAAYKEASKEGDEAGEALFGETEDEAEDNAGSDESPLRWRRRGPAPPRPRGTKNEVEDTAGSAEAPPRQQRGRGHRRLSRGPTLPATWGRISTAPLRRRPPATRQRTSPAPPRPRPAANEAAPHRKRGRVEHGRSPPLGST